MQTHTRKRPFICSYRGCKKSFTDREGLKEHETSHKSEIFHPYGHQSRNEAFETHRPKHEEHGKITTSAEEVHPIRLRLSLPKRPSSETLEEIPRKRLMIRIPMQKARDGSSRLNSTEVYEQYTEAGGLVKQSADNIERENVNQDVQPSNPGFNTSSTLDAIGNHQVSSRILKFSQPAMPQNSTPSIRTQAPAPEPTFKSRIAEYGSHEFCADGESSEHELSIYTSVCGVYSREKASPRKTKTSGGRYHCPRCDTQFTRSRSVIRHFVGCITKYGNPDSLKWTDHPSLRKTVHFYARHGYHGQEESREVPKDALLGPLVADPLPSIVEESVECVEPVKKSPVRDALLQKDIVQPICKRKDAFRRSNYNTDTISRDILLATGTHPNMSPLNAHLDLLRKKFRHVTLESNMSTFRWDLVESGQEAEQEAEYGTRQEHGSGSESRIEQEVESEQYVTAPSEVGKEKIKSTNDDIGCHDLPSPPPAPLSTKASISSNKDSFRVTLPKEQHFGSMSTIFSDVFSNDSSARFMSSKEDLWTAIFTMLERRYQERNFMVRAAVKKCTGEVVGWIACHDVDTLQAGLEDPAAYLDWTTAVHLLPSQLSRFITGKDSGKEEAERSDQRKAGKGLASTIQARATEAQTYLVPVHRLVINTLVVHPSHQGRGVASMLLKSITEIMDLAKRPIWIQTPEDPAVTQGVPTAGLFRRAGFTCAGELNLDLDSYSSERRMHGKEKIVSFGTYKWNYMLRWPHPVCQKPPQRRLSERTTKISLA